MLPKHDPPAARRCGERRERRFRAHLDLTFAGGSAQLLDAVGVHRTPHAAIPEIAAARTERVRTFDADIAGVELQCVAALDAVPLERLEVELRHDRVAIVRVEDIDVLRTEPR